MSGLPDPDTDFEDIAAIENLRVTGVRVGKTYVDSFINSNVAASIFGNPLLTKIQVDMKYARTDNSGTLFGLSTKELYGFRYTDLAGVVYGAGDFPIGDFQLRL